MLKKISLLFASLLLTIVLVGCLENIDDLDTLEFVNTPQSTYYQVSQEQLQNAIKDLYEEIIIKVNGSDFTLKSAIDNFDITVTGAELHEVGTHTLVIKYNTVTLTYVYRVVASDTLFAGGNGTVSDPYKITTPDQLINIGTRVFGVPRPTKTDEELWENYYKLSFPYLTNGMYFEIQNDLNFASVNFTTIGAFGDHSYVPFTGTLIGKQTGNENIEINNLKINAKGYAASLFAGASGATFKNIDFNNVDIQGSNKLTGTLWSLRGIASVEHINYVENVNVYSGIISGPRAGGLAGEASNSIFNNCTVGTAGVGNEKDLFIINTDKDYGGGLFSFATNRSYSYITRTQVNEVDNPVITLGIFEEKSGIPISDGLTGYVLTGVDTSKKYVKANYEVHKNFRDFIYDCKVYASLSAASGGKYSGGGKESVSIVFSSEELEPVDGTYEFAFNKVELLTSEMAEGEFSRVEYKLTFQAKDGSSLSDVPTFVLKSRPDGRIDFNDEGIVEYDYDEDGNIVKEYKPVMVLDATNEKYANITFVYYNAEGKIINIYRISFLNKYTLSFDTTTRVFTYTLKSEQQ